MSQRPFSDFFTRATGQIPYAYQCRLACGPGARTDQLEKLTDDHTGEWQLTFIHTDN